MREKISVVMAACSGMPYIQDQVSSILAQLDADDELIVSVDPSRDDTLSFLEKTAVSDPRVRVFAGPGRGVVANFSHGLAQASNPIIFLSDQDDVWMDGKVQTVCQAMEDSDVQAVLHNCLVVDESLQGDGTTGFDLTPPRQGVASNWMKNSFRGCCMAFRKDLLKGRLPLSEKLPMHDQYLGMLAMETGKVVFLQQPYLLYRRHGSNASSMKPASLFTQLRWRLNLLRIWLGRNNGRVLLGPDEQEG